MQSSGASRVNAPILRQLLRQLLGRLEVRKASEWQGWLSNAFANGTKMDLVEFIRPAHMPGAHAWIELGFLKTPEVMCTGRADSGDSVRSPSRD